VNALYRSPLEFVKGKSLEEAREAYERLADPYRKIHEVLATQGMERSGREIPAELAQASANCVDAMDAAMAEDFNSREAVARLFEWVTAVQSAMPHLNALSGTAVNSLNAPFRWAQEVLGLFEEGPVAMTEGWNRVVEVAIAARARARGRGDFVEADRIRDELARVGVRIEDRSDGTHWVVAPEP
jgi:cysteinyl-tRNA synthetase